MIHNQESPYAGQDIEIKDNARELGGLTIRIEDWWDRVYGSSWMFADNNIACLKYAIRAMGLPTDDEVLYGKIGGLGHLIHLDELEI